MRKYFLLFALLGIMSTRASAENITVDNVTLGRGGKAKMNVSVDVPDENSRYRAFQMDLYLPEGFSFKNNSAGNPEVVYTDRLTDVFSNAASNYRTTEGYYSIAAVHSGKDGIPVGSGPIFYMTIVADDNVSDGEYTGTISGIIFTSVEEQSIHFDEATFTITVSGEAITAITIDENSTEALTATTESTDIIVKRTINADEWSTLVLPFAMTGDEIVNAFGSTAKMAEFTEWSASEGEDDDGNPLNINLVFKTKDLSEGLEANHPVIIRVDHNITEFAVEDKTLDPEDEPSIEVNKVGSTSRRNRASFVGTYNILNPVEKEMLFLSGNKFFYSTGNTQMKGFRGYFDVPVVASAYYNTSSSSKVSMTFEGGTTGITTVRDNNAKGASDGTVYNLSGQRMGTGTEGLPRGVYIVNGKKVLIK